MYEETFVNNKRIIHEKKNQNPTNKPKGKNLSFLKCKGCCNLHNVPCLQTTCTLKARLEGGGEGGG
jgi:hypothetical protein